MHQLPALITAFLVIFVSNISQANIALPKIFSDNMVLQRDKPLHFWGWSDKSDDVTVAFNGQVVTTRADKNGNWSVVLKPVAFGGPFELNISCVRSGKIVLKNVLVGDVWICSGQSNMEWPVKNVSNAEEEIKSSNHDWIRIFTVQKGLSFSEQVDVVGGQWSECNSKTIIDFSAVAYFFGRALYEEVNIPIGLVNASWGGTNIQAWMSWGVMSKKEEFRGADIATLRESPEQVANKDMKFREAMKHDKGIVEKWSNGYNVSGWKKIIVPGLWEATEIGKADGIVWFKKEIELTHEQVGKQAVLNLGPIDDEDETYLNGVLVGSDHKHDKNRIYMVTPKALKVGRNYLVIKVVDLGGSGGIHGKAEDLFLEIGGDKIPLAGEWLYKSSALSSEFGLRESGPNAFPSQLFNTMIAPLVRYPIRGAIWYQGEANVSEADNYRILFPEMISAWRNDWGYQFPFYWVQLANFMSTDSLPAESEWAELREAQSMTLSLPYTGQAVAIDVGEAVDIHPRNKQEVGHRLALVALKDTYQRDIVCTGPVYRSMQIVGEKIILSFETDSDLTAKDKYGYLKGFAIAGNDRKFVWAKAFVQGNQVVVYNDSVPHPVAVRYAWGNNPEDANLSNKDGLPASPFRTDTWPGMTSKK